MKKGTSETLRIITLSLLGTTGIWGAIPAMAQDAAPQAAVDEQGSGDIIVTATRRDERLQDVPISIQALSQETLQERQVSSFDDYAKMLPSLSFDSFGPGQATPYFRGINSGGDGLDVGSLPTVGVYVDEIPVTTISTGLDVHMYDIARVEALAGPQGTLFGASSLAGTLRIITNKPDPSKFEAGYNVEANKFGKGDAGGVLEAFVNLPLSDNAAIRLVGFYDHDGGYIDNRFKQRTFTLDDYDPDTNVTVDNGKYVGKNLNEVDTYGGRAALKIDLDDDWSVMPQLLYQHQKAKGSFTYDPRVGDLQVHDFQDSYNKDRWYQAALTIQGKVGNWDLVYSGGYFERKIDSASDYSYYSVAYDTYSADGGASSPYYYTNFPNGAGGFLDPTQQIYLDYNFTKLTNELRVSSPAGDRFRLTAGLFQQRQTNQANSDYSVAGLADVPVDGLPNLYPVPGFGDAVFLKRLKRVDKDYAMFAEAQYDILPSLTLTAGIRGFMVDNSIYGFSGLARATAQASCVPTTDSKYPCINVDKVFSESGQTHKVSLAWKIDRDHMVYGTYSTGYRPGGSDRRVGVPPYKSDTLSNFELGWKTSWMGGKLRFNGALFYEKWDDIQFAQPGLNGVTYLLNAGGAEVKGVEADISFRQGGLSLSAGAAYMDAKLADDFCDSSGCTPKGTRLPVTPRLKSNATARYSFPLGGSDAFVQGSVNHQGGTRAALLNDDVADLGYTKQFTTFDFSAGTKIGSISVEAFIQNAFDKRGQLSRSTSCAITQCNVNYRVYPIKPQLFGLRFGQKF